MAKIKVNENIHEGKKYHHTQYMYQCEGCGYEHAFALKKDGGHHHFNMDLDNPTVSPSLVEANNKDRVCHSFIKEGKIQYLGDCHHHLKGQTIDLPEYKVIVLIKEEDEKTECSECGKKEVTTKFNTIDTWYSTCQNCGNEESYP